VALYRTAPPPPLRGLIRSFTYWEGGEPSTDLLTVLATRTPSLQIDLHDDELRWYGGTATPTCHTLRGVTLAGPQTRPFAVDAWQPRIVRVVFEPGGTLPFFAIPPADLRDGQVSLADVWSPAEQLQRRLAGHTAPADIFRTLGDTLVAAATDERTIRPTTAWALAIAERSPARLSVAALARLVETSPKRLIGLFADDIGLTPKHYLRIARFERLLTIAYDRTGVHWARAADEHGYFDQSHLIRDFKDFAGMTPSAYLLRRGPAEHHATSTIGRPNVDSGRPAPTREDS
jgi:AraC-like DNA-binding protein